MACRGGECVVIAMPAFAHCGDREPGDVVALHGGILDIPVLMSATMGDMGDVPVHRETSRDAHDHTPHDPWPSADQIERDPHGNLVQHPCALEEDVERIVT